ncbi:hypothetical protein LUCX_265 [Xanthomonas phage vB_XciM_LucasX]|nr:hypothetical protein LUCX_265 [Xanthomonas phage vB_XciM_LucasX]
MSLLPAEENTSQRLRWTNILSRYMLHGKPGIFDGLNNEVKWAIGRLNPFFLVSLAPWINQTNRYMLSIGEDGLGQYFALYDRDACREVLRMTQIRDWATRYAKMNDGGVMADDALCLKEDRYSNPVDQLMTDLALLEHHGSDAHEDWRYQGTWFSEPASAHTRFRTGLDSIKSRRIHLYRNGVHRWELTFDTPFKVPVSGPVYEICHHFWENQKFRENFRMIVRDRQFYIFDHRPGGIQSEYSFQDDPMLSLSYTAVKVPKDSQKVHAEALDKYKALDLGYFLIKDAVGVLEQNGRIKTLVDARDEGHQIVLEFTTRSSGLDRFGLLHLYTLKMHK